MPKTMFCATLAITLGLSGAVWGLETSQGTLKVEMMANKLDEPWSIAFLPDGAFLVTERDGTLNRFDAQGRHSISGLPEVWAQGQGGLFDILVPRDFAQSGRVFFSYAKPQGGGASTAVASARLSGDQLSEIRDLWVQPAPTQSPVHFGGRLLEDGNGDILLTTGDRGEGMSAQADDGARGRVLRISRDGSWVEEISRGHRNPQGLAFDGAGVIWESEHGARGGDEVNRIRPGANYGWPVISYGTNYDGSKIGEGVEKPGLQQPEHYWDPSIAPSGHVVYSGAAFPGWQGSHFIGSLKFDQIHRLEPGNWAEEVLKSPEMQRVRDVRQGPDGALWFLSVGNGAVYRIVAP